MNIYKLFNDGDTVTLELYNSNKGLNEYSINEEFFSPLFFKEQVISIDIDDDKHYEDNSSHYDEYIISLSNDQQLIVATDGDSFWISHEYLDFERSIDIRKLVGSIESDRFGKIFLAKK